QANLLVLLIGSMQPSGSEPLSIRTHQVDGEIGAAVAENGAAMGWMYVADYLREQGLATYRMVGQRSDTVSLALTVPGWSKYEEMQRQTPASRTAFMAMKFGDAELDAMFHDRFKPAVKQTGFDLQRLDTNPKPGLIDARMEVEIRAARFIVAD